MGLLLQAVDVVGRSRWRWLLLDELTGAELAAHTVTLDDTTHAQEIEAFRELPRFLRWNADPDRRMTSEAALVDRLGGWIGAQVLGPSIAAAIDSAAPVTVRVDVSAEADFLLYVPLELAHVGGVPMARRGDVSLVFDVSGRPGVPEAGAALTDRLQMVAVFSLPIDSTALALRRERYELVQRVRTLAARSRRVIELEVLQYGVTRELLKLRMTASGGPDVLHLSAHGGSGKVLLETPDGGTDAVVTADLVELLRPAKGRVRLAVLSACQSGAASTAETLRWLRLDDAADAAQAVADAEQDSTEQVTGLARMVAVQLGCAVVAMRYPVVDDFAIALTSALYEGLFELDLPVDVALRRAVPVAAGGQASASRPALSIATPTLLGPAAGLVLTPPQGQAEIDPAKVRMAWFPDEPERFVGRTGVLAQASRALAGGSGSMGVVFVGMAGGGKTACAVEVAYRHQDRFDEPVWWQAPLRDEEWPAALTGLALAWERQLADRGFTMVDKIGTAEGLTRFLPQLRALLRDNGLLIVLDNMETLLTPDGGWRDPRWASLMDVLTGHGGLSRLVLTSRVVPAGLPAGVLVEPVHALSRDETVLLARELPNLRRLLHAEPGPERAGSVDADRIRVRRVLHLVQGHPKLLELADRAAIDEVTLVAHLDAAERAAGDQTLTAFFTHGESTLDDTGFMHVLTSWTTSTMRTLPEPSQLLLQLLARIEEDDRLSPVVEPAWAELRELLGSTDPAPVPDVADAVAPLVAAALVEQSPLSRDPDQAGPPSWQWRLHPGVAETVRAITPADVRTAVDTILAGLWTDLIEAQTQQPGGEDSRVVARAGLAAAPYLLRLSDWNTAGWAVEQALMRDVTAGVAQVAVACLRRVVDATDAPEALNALGRAVMRVDAVEGERLLRTALDRAVAADDHRLAASVAGNLINLLRESGRLPEALDLADRKIALTEQAGLGPWTQLLDQAQRLQIVNQMGQPEQVLAGVRGLVADMAELPDQTGDDETVNPFNVRETVFNLGVRAANSVRRWQEALDLNADNVASLRARGAGDHDTAYARFGDYGPLIRLGRLTEAEQLLLSCQEVFEQHQDIPSLAKTLGARADLAAVRGQPGQAVNLTHAALRLLYTSPDPDAIATSHYNLALYLSRAGADLGERLAHRLAAATISQIVGQTHELAVILRALARDLREIPDEVAVPATLGEVAVVVERVDGVRFTALIAVLTGGTPNVAEQAIAAVLQTARSLSAEQGYDLQQHLDRWEPVLALLVAAVHGDQDATTAIDEVLTQVAASGGAWVQLGAVLRRVVGGECDPDVLLSGLDPVGTAIVARALDAIAGRVTLHPADTTTNPGADIDPATVEPWPAVIAGVVAAAGGDHTAATGIGPVLDDMASREDWAALGGVLRRIMAGDRNHEELLAGLDPADTHIAATVLTHLTTTETIEQAG